MKPQDDRWKVASTEDLRRVATASFGRTAHNWLNEGESPAFGESRSFSPSAWIELALFKKALEGGEPVRVASWDGNLATPAKFLLESLEKTMNVRLVMVRGGHGGNGAFVYSSEETMLRVALSEAGKYLSVELATSSLEVATKASQLFPKVILPDNPESGLIFSLAHSAMGGYSIRRLGAAGSPLERGNYNPAVLAHYDHIVRDLASASPCGRLTILSGAPGTGKTWLVRSLLANVPQAAFIVVPPQLVPELGSPAILPALTSAKNEFNGPICLILEDADKLLVNRKEGDMSAISSMLNLGDGILGAVLDIRILATTNAEKLEMDPATRRAGRLCRYIQVDPLEPRVASGVYDRLVKKPTSFDKPIALAEVYARAREAGWVAPPIANPRPDMKMHML